MTSRKGLAGAFLFASMSAFGQAALRPAAVAPAAPISFALPASLPAASLLMPAPLPVFAAAPALPAVVAASLPPAEARAAVLAEAMAGFERTDLTSASAGDASAAGDALMLRALGAASDSPAAVLAAPPSRAAPSSGRTLYLLSRPLRETVQLGPVAMTAHVSYVLGYQFVKTSLMWKALHSPAIVGTMLLIDLATMPSGLTMNTMLDLGQRYWRRKLAVLKELALTPGIDDVKVLTTGAAAFAGPIARSKNNAGLLFIAADGELPGILGRFGAPIPLRDPSASRVRLSYVQGETTAAVSWTPTLKDLLDGRPLPPDVAAAWRAEAKGRKSPARIESVYIDAEGGEHPVGEISQGAAVRKFIGLGLLDRVRALLGRDLPARAIPISETAIERPGDARPSGTKAALSRAWRRLTGRLIVAKKT